MNNPFLKLKNREGGAHARPVSLPHGLRQLRLSRAEAFGFITALVFIATVFFFYFSKVQPLDDQLESLRRREQELRTRLEKRGAEEKKQRDQTSNAELILTSLRQFESGLRNNQSGMSSIIDEMDTLGKKHKIIVGDASYRVEEADQLVDEKGNPLPETATRDRQETIYPGMAIDTTVIGDYPNLRRFISALEQSRQFLIINSLAFQGEGDKVRRETAKVGQGVQVELSSPEAVPVSLKLELDTYFQRAKNSR